MKARLTKSERLRKRREFLDVQARGEKVSTDCLLALAQKNDQGTTRVGITVSSKVGNAVVRNRIRRRLRELYRHRKAALPRGLDVVFIAKPSAAQVDFAALSIAYDVLAAKLARKFS